MAAATEAVKLDVLLLRGIFKRNSHFFTQEKILEQVRVRFNEAVDVTGTPQLTVVNDNRANHTLSYASGTGTNEFVFSLTIPAANSATSAGDVLSIGTNAMALNGGTVKDAGKSNNATITNVASIGTAAGTITVAAL